MAPAPLRFLADENIEYPLVKQLRLMGYDIAAVVELDRGLADEEVISLALRENRTILTNDRDFGELAVAKKLTHCGVIYLRMADAQLDEKVLALTQLLDKFGYRLAGTFTTLTKKTVRIRH